MRRVLFNALTATICLASSVWSQTVYGTQQSPLVIPGQPNGWNHHAFALADYSTGTFRVYWSCGNPDGICVGHATASTAYFDFEPISAINPAPAVCDIQDPGVVKYNGMYYLFAAGIATGFPNCIPGTHGNEHGAIYAFSSSDGVYFSVLNGGNPVIKISVDPCPSCYTGYGLGFPSPILMGSGSFIRLYYFTATPGYDLIDNGIVAMDTYDGVNFFNKHAVQPYAWAPSVKRVSPWSDYPLVMTYDSPYGRMAATSSLSSDDSWTLGNGGMPISTSPAGLYGASLEGDETGLFINSDGGPFTRPVSGLLNFWWENNFVAGSRLYRGLGTAAQFFSF